MEAESIQSLTPLLNQADQWREVLLLLPLLVALEAVLSADNAIALAAIARGLEDPARQRQALNLGLALALVFRLGLIVAARWVLNFWPLQLAAAAYLLWLCGRHLLLVWSEPEEGAGAAGVADGAATAGAKPGSLHHAGLGSIVATLALTDLAFSLDSVAAAVAVSDVYKHLETAGYLAVGLVGMQLLLRLGLPQVVPPEWLLLLLVAALFTWGFSVRLPLAPKPLEP